MYNHSRRSRGAYLAIVAVLATGALAGPAMAADGAGSGSGSATVDPGGGGENPAPIIAVRKSGGIHTGYIIAV